MALAIVKVLAASILIHEIDAAARPGRIDKYRRSIYPVAGKFPTNEAPAEIIAYIADKRRALVQLDITSAGVAARLPHVIQVFREVCLAAEVNFSTLNVHIGVDADVAHDDGVKDLVQHTSYA